MRKVLATCRRISDSFTCGLTAYRLGSPPPIIEYGTLLLYTRCTCVCVRVPAPLNSCCTPNIRDSSIISEKTALVVSHKTVKPWKPIDSTFVYRVPWLSLFVVQSEAGSVNLFRGRACVGQSRVSFVASPPARRSETSII